MRILCAEASDGTNPTFATVLRCMTQRGAQVNVLGWDRSAAAGQSEMRDGIEHRYLLHGGGFKNGSVIFLRPVWVLRLFVYLLSRRPDLLWGANFDSALAIAAATRFSHIPFIYYIHDNLSISRPFPGWARALIEALDNWIIRRAAAVIVPNQNRILPHAEKLRSKFHILPNTPDGAVAPPVREIPDRPFTVYATGSLELGRGMETLLQASEGIPDCRLLVVGRAPEPEIMARISAHPRVDFRGRVPHSEALELYNESDVVFAFYEPSLPIYVRASPTKLYESMMMAKPIIVNSEIMISQQIAEWEIGYDCGYSDAAGLEQLLRHIMAHRDEAAAKGRRARMLFETQFDRHLSEPKLWAIVEAAAARRQVAPS